MSAAAEEKAPPGGHSREEEPGREFVARVRGGGGGVVELDAAGDADLRRVDAEGGPAGDILVEGNGDAVEKRENGSDEGSNLAVSAFGAGRESSVGEEDGQAAPFREGDEIGPDFGFDEDEGAGIDLPENLPGDPRKIDRVVDHGEGFVLLFDGDAVAGGGGGAEDDGPPGRRGAKGFDEFQGEKHLADADGVDPEGLPPAEPCEDRGGEEAETLGETTAQTTAPETLDEKGWQPQEKKRREEQIVEEVDQGPGHRWE
jgi:hypothetical protein